MRGEASPRPNPSGTFEPSLTRRITRFVWPLFALLAIVYASFGAYFVTLVLGFHVVVSFPLLWWLDSRHRSRRARYALLMTVLSATIAVEVGLPAHTSADLFFLATACLATLLFDVRPLRHQIGATGLVFAGWGFAELAFPRFGLAVPWVPGEVSLRFFESLHILLSAVLAITSLKAYHASLARLRERHLTRAAQQHALIEAAYEKLSLKEKDLREAQSIAKIGNWSYDVNTGEIHWSPQMFKIFPEAPERGEPDFDRHASTIHPDDHPYWRATIEQCLIDREPYQMRFRAVHPDREVWVEVRGQARVEDGRLVGLFGTCQDISSLVLAEEARREVELKMTETFEAMLEGVLIHNRAGQVIQFNRTALRLLELGENQIVEFFGKRSDGAFFREDGTPCPPEEHPAAVAVASGRAQYHQVIGYRAPAGLLRWILVNAQPTRFDKQGVAQEVIVTFVDRTESVRHERKLTELKSRLETAVRAVGFGVWDWDLKTGRLHWESHMFKLFDVDEREFDGTFAGFAETLHPDDVARVEAEVKEALGRRQAEFRTEFRVRISNGEGYRHVACGATCGYDQNGEAERMVGCNWDISERVAREQAIRAQQAQLLQSAKMASLGEMAGGIAHEINNPLAIILAKAHQVRRRLGAPPIDAPQVEAEIAKIEDTAERIGKIIRGLRTFSRHAEGDPMMEVPFGDVLRDTLELCKERFAKSLVALQIEGETNLAVRCRPAQISQVLMNLLNNAHDAVHELPEKWIRVRAEVGPGERLRVSVTDSGHGISPSVVAKMMDPFFTTKEVGRGTGLGLSISKSILEDHGGSLGYDPTSHHTRFVLEVPLAARGTAAPRAA